MGDRHIARHAVHIWDWNFTLDQWFQIFVQGRFYVIAGFVDPFSRNHLCLVGNAVNWCMAVCDGVWRIGCPFQSDHGGGDAFFRQGDGVDEGVMTPLITPARLELMAVVGPPDCATRQFC